MARRKSPCRPLSPRSASASSSCRCFSSPAWRATSSCRSPRPWSSRCWPAISSRGPSSPRWSCISTATRPTTARASTSTMTSRRAAGQRPFVAIQRAFRARLCLVSRDLPRALATLLEHRGRFASVFLALCLRLAVPRPAARAGLLPERRCRPVPPPPARPQRHAHRGDGASSSIASSKSIRQEIPTHEVARHPR